MLYAADFQRTLWKRSKGVLAALSAAFLTTACAGGSGLGEQSLALLSSDSKSESEATKPMGGEALMKATDYWGKEYTKKPRDKDAALNYARNLKAMGQKKKALAVLQHAANFHSGNKDIASEYGRLALEFDQISAAKRLLSVADDPTKPDWRVISARGTLLAKEGQYDAAIPFYQRALALSGGQPSVLNNLALAHVMNGDAKAGETILRDAVSKGGPHVAKTRQNLALALGVQGKYNEAKSVAAQALPKAHASANANYLKKLVQLAPTDTPAPIPAPVQVASGPLTPEQIIAKAKAAGSAASAGAAPQKVVKTASSKPKKASVVRTVARTRAADHAPVFKPSSF